MRRKLVLLAGVLGLTTAFLSSDSLKKRAATASDDKVRIARIKLKTGVELEVAQRGPADGEPVLFLHGYTDSRYSYAPVLERLPAGYRAIVPSQRGHGDSERPECCYKVGDFAADAIALLDALGIERAAVVGHSMGSIIAQRIAIEYPARVTRLVLVGSGPSVRTELVIGFNDGVQVLTDPIPHQFVRDFQLSTAFKPLPPSFLDLVVRESSKVPARVWKAALSGLLADDALHDIDRIAQPTLVVWGAHDELFPRQGQDVLIRSIQTSKLLVYPGSGHAPNWEEPDRFVKDLFEFLRTPAQRPTSAEQGHNTGHDHSTVAPAGEMPLLSGLGTWHHQITTSSEAAQRYFDQGLRLMYAFNHDEATRSFERATALDRNCALCYWGVAYSLGPNINMPMDPKAEPGALAAIRRAQQLTAGIPVGERALINALARRYGEPAGAARAARDSAYANAMREVARSFPDDVDAQVLFADAMLNLRPWAQWTREGRAQPGTEELVAVLDRVLQRTLENAGACHLYVHAVEASNTPERALPCAEALPQLMPGAGHVVHMPAHVYLRVGRYEAAARANIAAVEADRRYFADRDVPAGVYPMFYAPHNLHFLWATYLLSGQNSKAMGAARAVTQRVSIKEAAAIPSLQAYMITPVLTSVRFRDWDAVLAEPEPARELRYLKGIWHYARGMARAAQNDLKLAGLELDSVRAIAAQLPDDMVIILNPAPVLMRLADHVLSAAVSEKNKRVDQALGHLHEAVRLEDGLTYDEPPPWYHSARNLLGETLLRAGRPAEAETAFRADLRYVRENGWSLAGLERSLRAQGKVKEASAVARRFKTAWHYADRKAQ